MRETKMQSLHYRSLHRIITCNHLLHRWRMRDDAICTFCDQEDTLEHFFFACHLCRTFWAQVRGWLLSTIQLSLAGITLKEFLLGVPRDFPQATMINLILLWIRYFIHRQKLFAGFTLNLEHWVRELRIKCLVGGRICEAEGRASTFKRWQVLLTTTAS